MATIDMTDDESELDSLRVSILGEGNRRETTSPPVTPPTPAPATAPASALATAVADQDTPAANPLFTDPAHTTPMAASQASEFAPRPSFAAARPRQSGAPATSRPPTPAPTSAPIQPATAPEGAISAKDATPGDVVDAAAETTVAEPPTATAPAPASRDADISALLGGIDVAQLRKVLANNPDLLNPAPPADADPAPADVEEERARPAPGLARSDLATQGWRSWLVKLGIPMRKGATERYTDALDSACEVIRRELDGPLVIGVTSYRGSCGKTSTTVLLARLLAEIRGHDVLALDTDLHGTLLTRSVDDDHPAGSQGTTMPDAADRLRDGVDLHSLARDGGDGYTFIPGSQTFRANALGVDGYQMIIAAARQVYPIVLVDMAQLSDTALYAEVLASLDGLVMMSPTAEDGVGYLYRTQSELQHRGVDALNGSRITALNNVSSLRSQVDTEEFARGLKHRDKRDVVEIPYDRHLASAKAIEMSQLADTTKAAFTFSLAALMDTFER